MPAQWADRLGLPPMVAENEDSLRTAYTVSVDAREGVRTGISAADRARTLRVLADPATTAADLVRPGHVLPLRARAGGVLERAGHTEAAVDLCRLAGLAPVAVIGELVQDDGTMTRLPGLLRARRRARPASRSASPTSPPGGVAHGDGRRRRADDARRAGAARRRPAVLPTRHGELTVHGYRDLVTGAEHVALVSGDPTAPGAVVRLHSECLTGDAFGSLRCDCGAQLDAALAEVARHGGAVVYLRDHEGRGIGLLPKLAAYALQDDGRDTVEANLELGLPADARDYAAGAADPGRPRRPAVRLLTNNPDKVAGLRAAGVRVRGAAAAAGRLVPAQRRLPGHQARSGSGTTCPPSPHASPHERPRARRRWRSTGPGCGSPSWPRAGTSR